VSWYCCISLSLVFTIFQWFLKTSKDCQNRTPHYRLDNIHHDTKPVSKQRSHLLESKTHTEVTVEPVNLMETRGWALDRGANSHSDETALTAISSQRYALCDSLTFWPNIHWWARTCDGLSHGMFGDFQPFWFYCADRQTQSHTNTQTPLNALLTRLSLSWVKCTICNTKKLHVLVTLTHWASSVDDSSDCSQRHLVAMETRVRAEVGRHCRRYQTIWTINESTAHGQQYCKIFHNSR